jgi:hypothetical protein
MGLCQTVEVELAHSDVWEKYILTYFIRHTAAMDIEATALSSLWSSHTIAIHYPHDKQHALGIENMRSLDPDDYGGSARSAMRALVALAKTGGYVCAQYYGHHNALVGCVEPDSTIDLLECKWGDRNRLSGRRAVLKTLQLNRVLEIDPSHSVAILAGRPRQGTLMKWPNAGKSIENYVEGKLASSGGSSDLLPHQQEVACCEFLRLPESDRFELPRLVCQLMRTGGTMKDIDICGLASDGKKIFAQVTHHTLSDAKWKLDRLRPYIALGDSHRV